MPTLPISCDCENPDFDKSLTILVIVIIKNQKHCTYAYCEHHIHTIFMEYMPIESNCLFSRGISVIQAKRELKVWVIHITTYSIEAFVVSYTALIDVWTVTEAQGTGRFIQGAASDSARAYHSNYSTWEQVSFKTRYHSRRMGTAGLPTVCVSVVVTRCQ